MHFRCATAQDIPAMSAIRLAVQENRLSDPAKVTAQMYLDYLDRLGRGWVCEFAGRIIGFSYADKNDNSIWALFVSPEYEGIGAGKGLLKLAVEWLFANGAESVKLGTTINTRAENFYQAQGWVRGDMKDDREIWFSLHKSGRQTPC